ncbi:ATP-binding protein [Stutzerimonas balearica]|uniref:ATP-binding protein n=1 Tax=Stutzerimonas balearica TaxID=74829 RepID=UPI0022AF3A0C|nr:ATP-binding protein [Stutzerimonas balearica]MCZ4128585.1 ATP-binding protein [Stutzerimonas balearica]
MTLPIISADQRLSEKRCAKVALVGVPGAGKTSQIRTLNAASTLLVDTEAGDLSILDWAGDTLRPRTWPEFKDLVVFLAGPSPSASPEQAFSQAHFDHVCQKYGDPAQLAKYDTYFVDSLTVLSRMCLAWCKTQPAAFSEKTGKPDTRGAYGLLGTEMIGALTHLQHVRDKHVIYVCILEEKLDDFNRRVYQLQLEGAKTSAELPGVLDEVITLAILKADDGTPYRAFVTGADNTWGFPSKDRSGRLDPIEDPHLGKLIAKCLGRDAAARPATPAAQTSPAFPNANEFQE